MAIFVNLFVAFSTIVLTYTVIKKWRYYLLLRKLPSPKGHFIFGNAIQLIGARSDVGAFRKLLEPLESSSIICLWIFHIPKIILMKHDSAEVLLSSNQEIKKAGTYDLLHSWLGFGLLTSSGNRWRSHRKLLTPSFHFRILENFLPIFNEQSETLVTLLSGKAGKGIFDVYPFITRCTMDIICETAMGKRIDTQLGKNSDYFDALTTVADMVMHRTMHPWLLISWIFELSSQGRTQKKCLKILHGFTENVIKERRKEYKENRKVKNIEEENDFNYIYGRKNRMAFLDTLLEASDKGEIGLTDEMIREETDTFMFEGHDTTAVNITWVIHFLSWCPSVQKVVHQELDKVFENSDRPVNFADLNELKYLEAVIKETLRLAPSVPFYGREITQDINIGGYTIPRGAEVIVSPAGIGQDAKIFPNPRTFDPTRFFNEDFHKRHPYAYVPFSAGPRNCIGQKFAMMEEKVVLANIFRKFELKSHNNLESLKPVVDLVFRPGNGMYITLENRNRS